MKSHPNAAFWKEHVTAALQDPVSISAYAKRHDIAVKSLYYWNKKLKKSGLISKSAKQISSAFIAVHVPEKIMNPRTANFRLMLATGIHFEMNELPAPEWLASFVVATKGMH